MKSKLIKITVVSAALFAASPTLVGAQTTTSPGAGTGAAAPANTVRNDDSRGGYGWVGLIGLVGLAGLMGRNRHTHTTTNTPPVGTRRDL